MKQGLLRARLRAIVALLAAFAIGFPLTLAYAETDGTPLAEEGSKVLTYNAAENFSDLGSDFWNYYFIDDGEDGILTELQVHGGGLFTDAAYDGTMIQRYKYVVGDGDFVSGKHDYLGLWGGISFHPGPQADVVLSFVAPVDGVIEITAKVKKSNNDGDGTRLYTTKGSLSLADKVYPAEADYLSVTSTEELEYSVRDLEVKAGDEIFFRLNRNENNANDNTFFSPTVTYTSYTMPENVSVILSDTSFLIPIGGIRLLGADISLHLGQTLDYRFSSSDESVVTVRDNGLIYAVGEGSAVITVTETGTGLTAFCSVTVQPEQTSADTDPWLILGLCIGGILLLGGAAAAAALYVKKKKRRV